MTANKPIYEIHSHYSTDGKPTDISSRVVNGGWRRSLDAPFGGTSFQFKCRYQEKGLLVNNGDWVVVRDPFLVAYDLFYVTSVRYSYDSLDSGAGIILGNVTAIGWMDLLGRTQIFVPEGYTQTVGTVMWWREWVGKLWSTVDNYVGALGEALREILPIVAKIRLPKSLGGEWLGDAIPVVYDEDTAKRFCPDLVRTMDPINTVGGFPTNLSFNFTHTSVLELLHKAFVASPHLIEMIPYMAYADLGTDPNRSKLSAVLKCRPVLVYRYRPWRTQALSEAATTYEDFRYTDDLVNAARVVDPLMQVLGLPASGEWRGPDPATKGVRDKIARTLDNNFNKVTWKSEHAKQIPWKSVRGFEDETSDDSRVNVTTIRVSFVSGEGTNAWPSLGIPMMNRDSVENHGARVMQPEWPYLFGGFNPDNAKKSPEVKEAALLAMRSVAAQAMQWHVNSHKLSSGSFNFDPLDAVNNFRYLPDNQVGPARPLRVLHLWSGDIFRVDIRSNLSPYLGYVHTVTHTWSTDPSNGAVTLSAKVDFIRGAHEGDALTTKPQVPFTEGPLLALATSKGAVRGAASGAASQPRAAVPLTSPRPINISAWTGRKAFFSPDAVGIFAARLGLDGLSLFVGDQSRAATQRGGLPWKTYGDADRIGQVISTLKKYVPEVWVSVWAQPRADVVDGIREVAIVGRQAGAIGVDVDAEEAWIHALRRLDPSAGIPTVVWSTAIAEAVRQQGMLMNVNCIVAAWKDPHLAPLLTRADSITPQAYATVANAANREPGNLEWSAYNLFKGYGKPIIMGAAAWNQNGAYRGLSAEDATAASVRQTVALPVDEIRYWHLWLMGGDTTRGINKGLL